MVRVLFGAKYLRGEVIKIIHPRAVIPTKIDRRTVQDSIQRQILGFLLFYLLILIASSMLVTAIEGDVVVGLVGTAATIGNIGPGFGEIGPMASFGTLTSATKAIFIFNMVLGRLELIPFLAMLHPDFWKSG